MRKEKRYEYHQQLKTLFLALPNDTLYWTGSGLAIWTQDWHRIGEQCSVTDLIDLFYERLGYYPKKADIKVALQDFKISENYYGKISKTA